MKGFKSVKCSVCHKVFFTEGRNTTCSVYCLNYKFLNESVKNKLTKFKSNRDRLKRRNNLGDKLCLELFKGTHLNEIFIKLILKKEQAINLKLRAKIILKDKLLVKELERTGDIYVVRKIAANSYEKKILEALRHNNKLNAT